jgi:hypothetical protein
MILHDDRTPGHARGFPEQDTRIVRVVEHIDEHHRVEAPVRERDRVAVVLLYRDASLGAHQHIESGHDDVGSNVEDRRRDRAVTAADVEQCRVAGNQRRDARGQHLHAAVAYEHPVGPTNDAHRVDGTIGRLVAFSQNAMNVLDRGLQSWRIRRALPWIPQGARVLDVGCFDDRLFRGLGGRLGRGVGLDPLFSSPVEGDRFRIVPGTFPDATFPEAPFDVITMLAVLEHAPPGEIDQWANACSALLVPGGLVVATVPSPQVDAILGVLMRLRILDGMEKGLAEQHHGFEPAETTAAFERAGFTLVCRKRFQLGLNNVFVLRNHGGA